MSVIRIDSPGGSAVASDQMWKAVVDLSKVKPVAISMGDYAASGGYYISCAGSKVFAERGTITGSIGVISGYAEYSGLLEKLKINAENVKTTENADAGDGTRPITEKERANFEKKLSIYIKNFLTEFQNQEKYLKNN